jgi:hypothetical protein
MHYTSKTLEYFYSMRHALAGSAAKNLLKGCAGHHSRGDFLEVFILCEEGLVAAVHYKLRAQVVTSACMEYLASILEGCSIDAFYDLTGEDILNALELPHTKIALAQLPLLAVANALATR